VQLLQMFQQVSKYKSSALVPPSGSVNSLVVNVAGLSPVSVIGCATPAVNFCSEQAP